MDQAAIQPGSGLKSQVLVGALLAGLVLVSCGGASASSKDTTIAGEDVTVRMFDNRYEYKEIRIPVGGTVTWLGGGRNPHNASDADGAWTTETVFGSLDQYDGDAATLTYDQPGVYTFFCSYHGNAEGEGMAGILIVGDTG